MAQQKFQPVVVADDEEVRGPEARTPGQIAWSRLKRDRVAWVSSAFILLLVLFALAYPLIVAWTDHDKAFQDSVNGSDDAGRPVGFGENGYVLGATGPNGFDMLAWLSYGARVSLFIGVVSTAIVLLIALLLGLIAGYYGGWRDTAVSRVIDVIAAFPFLLFAISMAVVFGVGNIWVVIGVISFFSWFYPARLFRADILALREREFVEAARMAGASNWRIMRRHLFPHLIPPMIVFGTLAIAGAIGFEAALSFLGFGLDFETPSWGQMINNAVRGGLYRLEPRIMLLPGTLLLLTVLAFNLLGDAFRDALDPRGAKSH